ncbi:MAG: curli-like amyloid fiber formation chaperone CsgH [Bacteroidota bacterium]
MKTKTLHHNLVLSKPFRGFVVIIAAAFVLTGFVAGQNDTPDCTARIEYSTIGHMTEFTAVLTQNSENPLKGNYLLEAVKSGKSGRSSSRQSGEFEAEKGEKTILSQTSLNISTGDEYTLILTIWSGQELLCSDTLSTQNIKLQNLKKKKRTNTP